MKVIYIAGKFRGDTPWDVEQNIRKAETFALDVAGLGGVPMCPHPMTRYFDKQLTDKFWLDATAELLRRCDAMALVPGNWRGSSGTAGEIEIVCGEMSIPVFAEEAECGPVTLGTNRYARKLSELRIFCN